jgi:hypothetical protein
MVVINRNSCIAGDATVTIAHRYTPREQLKIHTQLADVIVVAAGKSLVTVIWWNVISWVMPTLSADTVERIVWETRAQVCV